MSALDARNPSTSSRSRNRCSSRAIRLAAGLFRTRNAFSTFAVRTGMPGSRVARSAQATAARAVLLRRRGIAIPATTSSRDSPALWPETYGVIKSDAGTKILLLPTNRPTVPGGTMRLHFAYTLDLGPEAPLRRRNGSKLPEVAALGFTLA